MLRRGVRWGVNLSAVLCWILLLAGILPVGELLRRPLVESQPPRPADAIVILGGGVIDEHLPSDVTMYRLIHGLRLFERRYAPLVILTGGNPDDPDLPESQVMADVAFALGIAPAAVVVEREAARTATQAWAVARIAAQRNIRSILLVTSAAHSLRAVRAFTRTGLHVISVPPVSRAPQRPWIRRVTLRPQAVLGRLGDLAPVLYEYGALAMYWWRGWI